MVKPKSNVYWQGPQSYSLTSHRAKLRTTERWLFQVIFEWPGFPNLFFALWTDLVFFGFNWDIAKSSKSDPYIYRNSPLQVKCLVIHCHARNWDKTSVKRTNLVFSTEGSMRIHGILHPKPSKRCMKPTNFSPWLVVKPRFFHMPIPIEFHRHSQCGESHPPPCEKICKFPMPSGRSKTLKAGSKETETP